MGEGAALFADAVDEVMPPLRWRVELDAAQVVGGGAWVDGAQFDGRSSLQHAPLRGSRCHFGGAGQDDYTERGLLADRDCPVPVTAASSNTTSRSAIPACSASS